VSLQIADALRGCLKGMIFIVGSDQILSQNLDPESSALIRKRIEAQGGTFLFHRSILQVEGSEREIRLASGRGRDDCRGRTDCGEGGQPQYSKV